MSEGEPQGELVNLLIHLADSKRTGLEHEYHGKGYVLTIPNYPRARLTDFITNITTNVDDVIEMAESTLKLRYTNLNINTISITPTNLKRVELPRHPRLYFYIFKMDPRYDAALMSAILKSIRSGLSQILNVSKIKTSCCILGTFHGYSGNFITELTNETAQMCKNAFIEDDVYVKYITEAVSKHLKSFPSFENIVYVATFDDANNCFPTSSKNSLVIDQDFPWHQVIEIYVRNRLSVYDANLIARDHIDFTF